MEVNKNIKPTSLVMKFGGTSVGNPDAFLQAISIVRQARQDWQHVNVILSAMTGVTDLLLESISRAISGQPEFINTATIQLRQKHFSVIEEIILDGDRQDQVKQDVFHLINDFASLCQAIAVLGEATPRVMDAVVSLGERLSIRIFAAGLNNRGIHAQFVEATELIVTDDIFQGAHPDFKSTTRKVRHRLYPLLENGTVPVITGFIGATSEGITTTLGRGGSDYSAAILGAVLPADEVWIWTDVNGVMTADPRLVPTAKTIPILTYREIAELAYFGAKVVHPKTIRPVIEAGINLRVANTFNPSHPGTKIINDSQQQPNGAIKAVTAIRGQSLITVEGRGMLGVPGVAARTFGAVAATGTSVPLITQASSEQSICFAVPFELSSQVVSAVEETFEVELKRRDIDRIWATDEVVIVTVVGAGMRNTPGIAGKIFSALGLKGVNVIAIAQGSSEVSISLVVDAQDVEPAVHTIHGLITDSLS